MPQESAGYLWHSVQHEVNPVTTLLRQRDDSSNDSIVDNERHLSGKGPIGNYLNSFFAFEGLPHIIEAFTEFVAVLPNRATELYGARV